MKKALFLIILLFSSCFQIACFQMVFCATDEGYGEDETALGQFVESFEDLNNITVIEDLVRNSTLNLIELNSTGAITEVIYNLTRLREHDYFGATCVVDIGFTIVANNQIRMISTAASQGWGYMFLRLDRDFLDDKYVRFRYQPFCDVVNVAYQTHQFQVRDGNYNRSDEADWPSINWPGSQEPPMKGNGLLYSYTNIDGLNNWFTKDFQIDTSGGSEDNVTIWFRFNDGWNARVLGLWIDWIEVNGGPGGASNLITIDFNDLSPINMEKMASEGDYGVSLNPELPFFSGGYEDEGYFITDDYLNDTACNGTALSLMLNSSIPANTDIQVQFSNDNATWGDWEGIPLDSNILSGGFETIDLRYLNETDVYLRFNLSTLDPSLTPRLYQARLISTIGNQTGGAAPGPSGGGAIGLIMLILISSPLIVLIVWGSKKR